MREKLIAVLEKSGYPAYLQGSFTEDQKYPETFFTFWEFQAEDQYYDNVPVFRDHGYWVYCYSIDPDRMESLIREIEQSLREKGFIVEGGAIDAKSDEASHTGKMITVYVKEDLYGKRNL